MARVALALPYVWPGMTQRWIEIVIGRLVTDAELRRKFTSNPGRAVADLLNEGVHLTPTEMAALLAVDAALWKRVAGQVDPRLWKPETD